MTLELALFISNWAMKVYRASHWLKILAWFLLTAFFVKIILVLNNSDDSFIMRGDMETANNYQPPNEMLELEKLLLENAHSGWSLEDNCAPYPRIESLQIENDHYQFTMGGNVSYYMFAAYYDRRQGLEHSPRIALLAMVSNISGPFPVGYCQVWFEGSNTPDIVTMEHQGIVWYEAWGNGEEHVYPVVLGCPLHGSPRQHRVPQLVSLVFEDQCARPSNALRVYYEAPERKRAPRFAVCVKDLQFPTMDMSERWVEWFELMRLLGVERVTAYDRGGDRLMPRSRRTLQHYAKRNGLLHLRPFKSLEGHPKPASNKGLSQLLNEVLMYVDCFYRNMYQFDYIAVMDTDEVIMPLGELNNWTALVQFLEWNSTRAPENCDAWASYCFRNVYYSKELPVDETPPVSFHMLRHVRRVADHLDGNSAVKCLHATAYVTSVHNHFPLSWQGACGPYDVPTSVGQMQHYREPDNKETLQKPPPVRDDNIWRFKEQLMSNGIAVHRQLGWPLP